MKKILILLVIASLTLFSCKTNEEKVSQTNSINKTEKNTESSSKNQLENKQWMLTHFNEKKLELSLTDTPQMSFDANSKKIEGKGICNNFFGTYAINTNEIEFKGVGVTRMMCPPSGLEEHKFFQIFDNKIKFEIKGNELYFKNSDRKEIARFSKK
ncbi:MAG: META domain-containing protein [Flavobacteriales bacterium]|jgi:putative lipoprotein|nr:META domain-containing protein [Flavobacteriales bacterium]